MVSPRRYEGASQPYHHHSYHPESNTASKLRVMDRTGILNQFAVHAEEETQGSGSSSGLSDLSALENETDDFGRMLLQHQRDVRRLNNAVRGGQQAFRKAKPRPRVAEQFEREDRESLREHVRAGSAGSHGSDSPAPAPREWGRRARRQGDWMRSIRVEFEADREADVGKNARQNGDHAVDAGKQYAASHFESDEERPPQSVENTPPSMRRHGRPTPASSMRNMNMTVDHAVDSDNDEFTYASLLASTPAPSKLPRKIDSLTRDALSHSGRQPLATREPKRPADRISDIMRSTSSPRSNAHGMPRPVSPSSPHHIAVTENASETSGRVSQLHRSPTGNKENMPLRRGLDPKAGSGGAETVGGVTHAAAQAVSTEIPARPRYHRSDSMNLLRKLARDPSMSPSPAKKDSETWERDTRPSSDVRISNYSSQRGYDRKMESPPENAQTKEEKSDTSADAPKIGHVHALSTGWSNESETTDKDTKEPKTPVVTGAWVDSTIMDSTVKEESNSEKARSLNMNTVKGQSTGNPESASSNEQASRAGAGSLGAQIRPARPEQSRPQSALEDIVRNVRNLDNSQQYGESTVQSLEDIYHPDLDPTDPTLTFEIDNKGQTTDEWLDSRPLTQTEKDRRQEQLAMEGMNKHLRSARTSIKDANRGLRRVENRFDIVDDNGDVPPAPPPKDSLASLPGTHPNPAPMQSHYYCAACGRGSVWRSLWSEFLSCFWVRDINNRVHLTWLGLICSILTIWFVVEQALCWKYCQPLYAYRMKGFGVDPNAPEFPFVIPTLIFEPSRWLWQPVWDVLARALDFMWLAFDATVHAVFGDFFDVDPLAVPAEYRTSRMKERLARERRAWTEGMRFDIARSVTSKTPEVWAATTQTAARVARTLVDVVDEAGQVWNDDAYL